MVSFRKDLKDHVFLKLLPPAGTTPARPGYSKPRPA